MIQDGTAGLVKAVERFDPEKVRTIEVRTVFIPCFNSPSLAHVQEELRWFDSILDVMRRDIACNAIISLLSVSSISKPFPFLCPVILYPFPHVSRRPFSSDVSLARTRLPTYGIHY